MGLVRVLTNINGRNGKNNPTSAPKTRVYKIESERGWIYRLNYHWHRDQVLWCKHEERAHYDMWLSHLYSDYTIKKTKVNRFTFYVRYITMDNKAENFGTVKNLREWFDSALTGNNYLYRKVPVTEENPNGEERCYKVDLIWDGTNYHIAYEDEKGIRYVQPFTYTDERVWSVHTENQIEN